jgi:hypothetical protein
VPALKFHCVHGRNSNRFNYQYLGIYGDWSGGTSGVTRRILHLDGLIAAKTAEPSDSDPLVFRFNRLIRISVIARESRRSCNHKPSFWGTP